MRALAILIAMFLLATPAVAQAIKISADVFEVDDAAREATFTGNVVVDRDAMHLNADEVVVEYGPGGVNDIRAFRAVGKVRIRNNDQAATGDVAVYTPTDQVLRITGNVTVSSPMGNLSGPELVIDLKNNTSVFAGGNKGRVTGVFTPQ